MIENVEYMLNKTKKLFNQEIKIFILILLILGHL